VKVATNMPKKKQKTSIEKQSIDTHRKLKGKKGAEYTYNKDMYKLLSEYGAKVVTTYLKEHPREMRALTNTKNTIAIVSDGSHVGGIGNVKSSEILPTLEGKVALIENIADIYAQPVVCNTQNRRELQFIIENTCASYGGVLLDSIAAPKCFEVERMLKESLHVPVIQSSDCLAIATLGGLINALSLTKKSITNTHVAVLGAGANGISIAKLLTKYGIGDVVVVDRDGIISSLRTNISGEKEALAHYTNREGRTGGTIEAITGADVLIGTIQTGLDLSKYIKMMAQKPIFFALAEPVPEILPREAKNAGAEIVATQSISYPNHISNAHVIPGIARGIVEHDLKQITQDLMVRIAESLAGLVKNPTQNKLLPTIFDRRVVSTLTKACEK